MGDSEFYLPRTGQEFYEETMSSIAHSLTSICETLPKILIELKKLNSSQLPKDLLQKSKELSKVCEFAVITSLSSCCNHPRCHHPDCIQEMDCHRQNCPFKARQEDDAWWEGRIS